MSVSRYIKGISNAERVEKANKIRIECEQIGIEVPDEVWDILDDDIEIPQIEYTTNCQEIIEIKVKDIPKEVEKIQFITSY